MKLMKTSNNMKDVYLTEFEKMVLEFIENKNVKRYSDKKSFKIFQKINKEVRKNLDKKCVPIFDQL